MSSWFWNPYSVTSAAISWPKELTRPAQIPAGEIDVKPKNDIVLVMEDLISIAIRSDMSTAKSSTGLIFLSVVETTKPVCRHRLLVFSCAGKV